jgi:Leucine-rich repeat (LRR) protein/Cdc6-like AAA superfamily ATPase
MALKYIIDAVKDPIQEQVVQTITELAVTKGWQALQKSHKVLSILKKLKLVNLAEDFAVVYVHALAEYGAEKEPKALVQLFALPAVREALENDHRSGSDTFLQEVEHQLHTSPQLTALKRHYPSVQSLQAEITEFQQTVAYVQMQAANPFALKQYNEVKKSLDQLLEEKHRNSFEGQVEQYLDKQITAFQQKYLESDKYIDLNGKVFEMTVTGIFEDVRGIKQAISWPEDPNTESPVEHPTLSRELKSTTYAPLDKFINSWLKDTRSRLLVIMGEYGTGKTTFASHLTHQLGCQYRGKGCTGTITDEKQRIPLFLPLRNFGKDIGSFVSDQCSNDHGITTLHFGEFKQRMGELLVIFDGFDEMTQRVDAVEKRENFAKLNRLLEENPNGKFILTCREEYFQSKEELKATFRSEAGLDIVYLLPLDEGQIKQFLRSHTDDPVTYWKQIDKTFDLKDLAKRPVLLELIIKYLPKLLQEKKGERIRASDLYQACIEEELSRVADKLNTILPGPARLDILKRLAAWMYVNDTLSFDTREIEKELALQEVFNVKTKWEYERHLSEFLTFTFLLREDDYQFRMSHKSFRDYLAALVFLEEVNKNAMLHFPKRKISGEVQSFMLEHPLDQKHLLALVKSAKGPEVEWQGTNAANLLLALDKEGLAGENLSECVLKEVNFWDSKLEETSLHSAILTGSRFTNTIFAAEGLSKADLSESSLTIAHEKIQSLNGIEKMIGLKSLDCAHNSIMEISLLSQMLNLRSIWCYKNKIEDIASIATLSNLQILDCSNNQIRNIEAVGNLTNLIWMECSSNQITDISPIARLTNLQLLSCYSNQISDLAPVAELANLQHLSCHSNQIADLAPVAELTKLNEFDFSSNQIADLSPIAGLANLQELSCSSNQIADLAPVARLANLQSLSCGNNQIADIAPVAGLANLQKLYCHNNPITDLSPLYGLKNLRELQLSKGQFSEKALAELREAVPGLEVKLV